MKIHQKTSKINFDHINEHEKCMPDPILILPELQNLLNDEFLRFLNMFLTFSKNRKKHFLLSHS